MYKIKKATPTVNHIITTADRYEETQLKDGLIDVSKEVGQIKEIQKVVAIGPLVRNLKVGDYILINPDNYAKPVHSLNENSVLEKDKDEVTMEYRFPLINLADGEYMHLYDSDADLVLQEGDFEEVAE